MNKPNRQHFNPILKITPIGGVGEIGSNMTLLESEHESIVIDCGILFPDEEVFDLKYLIPNFDYFESEPSKIIITHGHQDHIGAVSHFVERFPDAEIYASPFSAELIRNQFKERRIRKHINIYKEDDFFEFEPFSIHPIHVNHSIPETYGMLIKHNANKLAAFFISDFKIDEQSPYERPFDFEKLIRLSKDCKERLLLADSTNILNPSHSLSENDLIKDIEEIVAQTEQRTYITLFSSNIHRIQTIVDACNKFGKDLTFVGRSIYKYTEAAVKTNQLKHLQNVFLPDDKARGQEKNLVVLLTGCQGDFFGALRRLAKNELTGLNGNPGDKVVFSSKVIPGNETNVYNIYNELTKKGYDIISARDKEIHASGHACAKEIKILTEKFQPTHYIPIHGETFFLKRHCELIKEEFPKIKTYFMNNFSTIQVDEKLDVELVVREELEPILIHGDYLKIDREKISERRKMATKGQIFVSVKQEKKYLNFKISMKGLPKEAEDQLDNLRIHLKSLVKVNSDEEKIEETVRVNSKRFIAQVTGYRPEVLTHIIS